jgi:predicted phage terminase large subunit-like protein
MHYAAKTETLDKKGKTKINYLFPQRFSRKWYENMFAILGNYSAAALLQGDPVIKGGNIFEVEKIKYINEDELPDGLLWSRGWDLASTEDERDSDDPDYTAGTLAAVRIDSNDRKHLYVRDSIWCRAEAPARDAMIKNKAKADGAGINQNIESVGGYKDAFTTLKKVLKGTCVVNKVTVNKDKVVRASELEPIFEAGNVYFVRGYWNSPMVDELADFPGGAHDDKVDSLVIAYNAALQRWYKARGIGGGLEKGAR